MASTRNQALAVTYEKHAFEVIKNYNAPDHKGTGGEISVKIGQMGVVQIPFRNDGYAAVKLLDEHNHFSEQAYLVPQWAIKTGAKIGNLRTRNLVPVSWTAPVTEVPRANTCFEAATKAFFQGIGSNKEALSEYATETVLTRISESPTYANAILQCTMPDVEAVIRSGLFDFEQLWALPQIRQIHSDRGIFLTLYKDCNIAGRSMNAWYVGMAEDMGERYRQHKLNIESTEPLTVSINHYRIARTATEYRMLKLVDIPETSVLAQKIQNPSAVDRAILFRVAEQLFVSLLHSWNPEVFVEPTTLTNIAVRSRLYKDATIWRDYGQRIFRAVGWPLNMTPHGANWSTPISEHQNAKLQWTSYNIPSSAKRVMDRKRPDATKRIVFRREPTKLVPRVDGSSYLPFMSKRNQDSHDTPHQYRDGPLKLHVPADIGIPARHLVHLVCEIALDGPHPTPYARLPKVGPWSNWEDLNRLGISIEWEHNGWHSFSLEATHFYDRPRPDGPAYLLGFDGSDSLSQIYRRTTRIMDALLNATYVKQPSWAEPPRKLRMQHFHFDFMKQEQAITKPERTPTKAITLRSYVQNGQAILREYGAPLTALPDLIIGGVCPPGLFVSPEHQRTACDLCLIHSYEHQDIHSTHRSAATCTKILVNGEQCCEKCASLRRPCTWTRTETLRAVPHLHGTLGVRPRHRRGVETIGNPGLDMEIDDGEDVTKERIDVEDLDNELDN